MKLRTVREVSVLTGVSVRTLQYYDRIGLLRPAAHSDAGYRLYDEESLMRLREILLFRELEFPLSDIREMLAAPDYSRQKALEMQITLLEMRRTHLENLIAFARNLQTIGVDSMDFTVFDKTKLEEYAAKAKASFGDTDAYREYETRQKGRTDEENRTAASEMMAIFTEMGRLRGCDPACAEMQALVRRLRDHITGNWYTCTNEILSGLGQAYAAGGEMTENIDRAGGEGTAVLAAKAIEVFCAQE